MSAELSSDDQQFLIPGAVWVLLQKGSFMSDDNTGEGTIGPEAGYVCGRSEDIGYVLAFTDHDLAERFVEQNDPANLVAVSIEKPEEILKFARRLQKAGHSNIGFDPPMVRVIPVTILIEALGKAC